MFKIDNYVTAGKLEAKVLMIDNKANYPLIGAIRCEQGWWITQCWDKEGIAYDLDEDFEMIYDEDLDDMISSANIKNIKGK